MFLFSIPKTDLGTWMAGNQVPIKVNGKPAHVLQGWPINGQPSIALQYDDSEVTEQRIVCETNEQDDLVVFHCMEVGSELTIVKPTLTADGDIKLRETKFKGA